MLNTTKNIFLYFVAISSLFMMWTCTSNESKTYEEKISLKTEFEGKVNHSAGQILDWGNAEHHLPFIFNIGDIQIKGQSNHETIILSEEISQNQKVGIKPIGVFSFSKTNKVKHYIISVPLDEELNKMKIHSYDEFNKKGHLAKFFIEDWFRGQCELGDCQNFRWNGPLYALNLLDKSENG